MSTNWANSEVQPLIEGYQNHDPRLYDILSRLANQLTSVQKKIFPIEEKITIIDTPAGPVDTPVNFRYSTANHRNLVLSWDHVNNAIGYEIRKGNNWDTADFITRTISTEVRLDPILQGTTRYLLKAINADGVYSSDFSRVDVIIPPIGNLTITTRVIDNNVLLGWSIPPSTWDIDFYTIAKGTNVIGIQKGTFIAAFESASGTFTYSITPVDIAGNIGPTVSTTLVVSQPPDFELLDYRVSLLDQKKVNALIYGDPILGWTNYEPNPGWDAGLISGQPWTWTSSNTGKLLVCVDLAQTYQFHFTSRSWAGPSSQVSAGYPIYIQPNPTTAQYQEVIDYGLVINNTLVNINYTLDQLTTLGTVTASPSIEFSLDGTTWTTPVNNKSAFGTSFRYTRITINFTSSNDKALALFYNLTIALNVKYDLDSGNVLALASDSAGTIVYFNKVFKDISSITVTATKSTEPLTIIYDFVDIPNPTFFKVLVYNSTGVRTDATVSWKARGIV